MKANKEEVSRHKKSFKYQKESETEQLQNEEKMNRKMSVPKLTSLKIISVKSNYNIESAQEKNINYNLVANLSTNNNNNNSFSVNSD